MHFLIGWPFHSILANSRICFEQGMNLGPGYRGILIIGAFAGLCHSIVFTPNLALAQNVLLMLRRGLV